MGLRDSTVGLLRSIFGRDREERENALSPSVEAEKHLPSSVMSTMGRDDVGGLLSVSQNLMDRYADYEAMNDYPDINCLDGFTLVFTLEYGWTYIKDLAALNKEFHVLAYDKVRKALVPALARNARLTAARGHNKQMVRVILDNGTSINCTEDHLFMKVDGAWIAAGKLLPTNRLMSGDKRNKLATISGNHKVVRVEIIDDHPDVYDLEVPTYHNFIANGVVVHNCFAEGSLVYVLEGSMFKPVPIETLAFDDASVDILAYSRDKAQIVKVHAEGPRLTGVSEPVIKIKLSNGANLRVTKDHKILHKEKGYIAASTLKAGDELVSMFSGFNPKTIGMLIHHKPGYTTVKENPEPDGSCRVFDVATSTQNLIVDGVVCHNSANHYFANDATQPDIDNGRTIWVHCKDDAIKNSAEVMLHKRLRLEDEIWSMAYTLIQLGNDYEELLVNQNGVVGLNFLPVPTVRRVERADGALVGFVQDVTGKFTEDAKNLRAYLAGKGQIPDHVAVFEDWQVCHMRLRSTHRRSPYGWSVADGSRWIWKRLVLLEDAVMIYRLTRSPSRFAFYIDVTDIPSDKVELFLNKAKQQLKKKSLVNPRTQRLDMRYNPISGDDDFFFAVRDGKHLAKVDTLGGPIYNCLVGDTKIPLLDGTSPTIKEMAEKGGEYWVYSCTPEGKVVPGKAYSPRMSSPSAEIWEVGLDNGEVVKCTYNHPFLTRDGKWVLAKDLVAGQALMPLNRRITSKKDGDFLSGYEQVYDPILQKYIYTHRRVHNHVKDGHDGYVKGTVIHHKNGKTDNTPDSLVRVTRSEHRKFHTDDVKKMHTPEVKAKSKATKQKPEFKEKMKASWTSPERQEAHRDMMLKRMADPSEKEKHGKILADWNRSDEHKQMILGSNHPRWVDITTEDQLAQIVKTHNITSMRMLLDKKIMSQSVVQRVLKGIGMSWAEFASKHIPDWKPRGRAASSRPVGYMNHKVSYVKKTEQFEPVYDLTVEETHCFAVNQGIFMHNSMEDIDYFKKMLHGNLKVPRAFLGQDGPVAGKGMLSSEDVRAARVTMGIQRELRNGIARIIHVDMAARGIDPWKVPFSVNMTVPSGIYELAQMEVKNARADFANRYMPFTSMDWVRRHIFKLSDEEIDIIEKQSKRDQDKQLELQLKSQKGMMDLQAQAQAQQMQQQQALQQAQQGGLDQPGAPQPPETPAPMMLPGSDLPRTTLDWKRYDTAKRLEELKEKKTQARINELEDKFEEFMQRDKYFKKKITEKRDFIKDCQDTMFVNSNGQLNGVPSGNGIGRFPG